MGRKPIGETAMTAAERQRRRRERLGIGGGGAYLPAYRPWDGSKAESRAETDVIDNIEYWLANGDVNAVTKWLADCLTDRGDDAFLDELSAKLRAQA